MAGGWDRSHPGSGAVGLESLALRWPAFGPQIPVLRAPSWAAGGLGDWALLRLGWGNAQREVPGKLGKGAQVGVYGEVKKNKKTNKQTNKKYSPEKPKERILSLEKSL